jgi:hypothetical protein
MLRKPKKLGKKLVKKDSDSESEPEGLLCMRGCGEMLKNKGDRGRHHELHDYPGRRLFVHLRHQLVFKTDIVISVIAQTKDARSGKGRSHITIDW